MGVWENFVLGHTDLKIVWQMCQSNNIVKKLFQNIKWKRTKVTQIDIIQCISSKLCKKRRKYSILWGKIFFFPHICLFYHSITSPTPFLVQRPGAYAYAPYAPCRTPMSIPNTLALISFPFFLFLYLFFLNCIPFKWR